MWRRIQASGSFFEVLPWTDCGRTLWKAISHLEPDILTGVPPHASSRIEKYNWCTRELGIPLTHVDKAGQLFQHYQVNNSNHSQKASRVITCWSYNKHYESGPNRVLIDDRESLREAWEAKGGIFVHHNGDLSRTLKQLVDHGIVSRNQMEQQGFM